jgi:hypothetical protein
VKHDGLLDGQPPGPRDRAWIPALFSFARITAFITSGARPAPSGSMFTIAQRSSCVAS